MNLQIPEINLIQYTKHLSFVEKHLVELQLLKVDIMDLTQQLHELTAICTNDTVANSRFILTIATDIVEKTTKFNAMKSSLVLFKRVNEK